MKIGSFSSLSRQIFARRWSALIRDRQHRVESESVSGRRFDMSGSLGYKVSNLIDIKSGEDVLNKYIKSNQLVAGKMSTAQSALSSLYSKVAGKETPLTAYQHFISIDVKAKDIETVKNTAKAALGALASALNVQFNGEYVFGGRNLKDMPFKDMDKAINDITKDFDDFIKNQAGGDPSKLTAADIKKFLDSPKFKEYFDKDGWKKHFSNADDKPDTSCISDTGETIANGVSANDESVKDTVKALLMGSALLKSNLSEEARSEILQNSGAILQTSGGAAGLPKMQEILGASQNRLVVETDFMNSRVNVLKAADADLASVDPAEAVTEVETLSNQLEISYQLTVRLGKLSLINYI